METSQRLQGWHYQCISVLKFLVSANAQDWQGPTPTVRVALAFSDSLQFLDNLTYVKGRLVKTDLCVMYEDVFPSQESVRVWRLVSDDGRHNYLL